MNFSDVYFIKQKGIIFQRIKTCFVVMMCLLTIPLSGHTKLSTGAVIATTRLPIHRNADNTYEIAAEINDLTIPLKRVGNFI